MTTYFARIMDAQTGSEGGYEFDGPPDLMGRTGDEIVSVFFDEVDHEVLHDHLDWELNAVMNNRERRVITAIGSRQSKVLETVGERIERQVRA